MPLSELQLQRYARQLALKEFTCEKQEHLLSSRVAILGSGLSAELCTLYLAASGIGILLLVSDKKHSADMASRAKALNPDIEIKISTGIPSSRDYIIDFTQNIGPGDCEKIAAKVHGGTPYILALISGRFSIVKKMHSDDACPSCVLASSGKKIPELHVRDEPGIAGPAAAAMAIGELAGYSIAPREALIIDASAGNYNLLKIEPSDNCKICGLFKKTG